ncbi:iron uptake transporter deferrochelatase/peroxidase subunit [Pseudokineococcus lusitanus]|uniref:Deferrochelatase n=1 Tax=Pseudokineococcus lusitanus TaxID=763993 RepID=A0A3N1HJQ7_9ACTN|nr:iron uptake transporter deferrochelatase/peroxidase subunit [Pseudokineococcus lusitanus]ROP42739.1 deferrochelatase/peroxidase EfeB [Pseudokineococcus lusitanus]
MTTDDAAAGPSRRRLLVGLGVAAGVAVGAGADRAAVALGRDPAASGTGDVVPFEGAHQAGVTTPVQAHLHLAALDVVTDRREEVADLLDRWTAAARALVAGRAVGEHGAVDGDPLAPPEDTGEAVGLPPARLTLTVGVGPSLFDDRFGLAARRPAALAELPPFAGDALDPARCGGDLVVQACADDPQVAVHAVRTLVRLAAGTAAVRWAQLGFGRASSTDPSVPTPRNLFGFKDGTANPDGRDAAAMAEHVWVGEDDDPAGAWLAGGSYLVARRVEMHVETWDRSPLAEQEQVVGRSKGEGAPLGLAREHDVLDATAVAGLPATSHVALAHPSRHGGAQMLRRGYSYVDGADGLGHLQAGLVFLAYQRDPRRAFVPVQEALSRDDAMNEYVRHTGSGVWAVLPGVGPGGRWGSTLLG